MKIGESIHSFAWNYVKYANMEGFRRDIIIIIESIPLEHHDVNPKWLLIPNNYDTE